MSKDIILENISQISDKKSKIDDIVVFYDHFFNKFSVGIIVQGEKNNDFIVELIKPADGDFNECHTSHIITGWTTNEFMRPRYSFISKYSGKYWQIFNYKKLVKLNPEKHDIYMIADIMNSNDLDLILLTINMINNGN